jgi:hypothetical protein
MGCSNAIKLGFTPLPNAVLLDGALSAGARLTYGVLLNYAWTTASVRPVLSRLAEDLKASEIGTSRYLDELEAAGLLSKEVMTERKECYELRLVR